jgi:hypothetical protein
MRVVVLCIIAVFFGEVAKYSGLPWYLATVIATLVYLTLAFVVCGGMVRSFVRELTGQQKNQLPVLDDDLTASLPKIAFGVLSSKQSADAIDEIAVAVFPHPVYVHHDFSKQPDFAPKSSNIHVLHNPVTTAWGDWSLVEASYCLMQAAMEDSEITHFQLLSEACLPVRPIKEFEAYLANECPDVMIDILSLHNEEAMVSHGWRYLHRPGLPMRIVRRASKWVWGKDQTYRVTSSVNLRLSSSEGGVISVAKKMIGRLILRMYARSAQEMLSENGLQHFAIGGQWFGANRRAVTWLLRARNTCVTFTSHYQRSHIPDESYLHTLLFNAQLKGLPLRIYPSNHALLWDGCGKGPDTLLEKDIERIRLSGKFFARKFSLMADDSVRRCFIGSKL